MPRFPAGERPAGLGTDGIWPAPPDGSTVGRSSQGPGSVGGRDDRIDEGPADGTLFKDGQPIPHWLAEVME